MSNKRIVVDLHREIKHKYQTGRPANKNREVLEFLHYLSVFEFLLNRLNS